MGVLRKTTSLETTPAPPHNNTHHFLRLLQNVWVANHKQIASDAVYPLQVPLCRGDDLTFIETPVTTVIRHTVPANVHNKHRAYLFGERTFEFYWWAQCGQASRTDAALALAWLDSGSRPVHQGDICTR